MADVTMPQLGETVTEGTITRWAKQVGDTVTADEVLFEVSTDKVDSEVPSPASGVLSEIRVPEGETADVGTVLAVIGSADQQTGGSADQQTGGSADQQTGGSADQQTGGSADQQTGGSADQQTGGGESAGNGNGSASAATTEPEPQPETTNSTAAAVAQEESSAAAPKPAPAPSVEGAGKVLSPIVRKLINENNLDASRIPATGAGGRITREDVERAIGTASVSPPSAPTAPPTHAPSRPAPLPAASAGERDTVVPFSNMRRRTAEHMIMSQATSAHTLVTIEVDFDNVDKVRKRVKEKFKQEEGVGLTYLPFITRALVDAIRDYPYVNASVGNNELIVHHDVNIGVAVDLDFEGLLVPVVHGADGLRMRQIARAIADIAYRARNKKIQADDISNGTFTITNAGGYGTFVTYPVINQPQVAILSTDGVKKRPVAIELPDGSDAIVVHPVGMLGLAWDHRAFDGAYASAFLAKVKDVLETRDWAGEL